MLLIIEVLVFAFAMYRRWFVEAVGLLIAFLIVQYLLKLSNIDSSIQIIVELTFIGGLILLSINKKKKEDLCESCGQELHNSNFSCNSCGVPLTTKFFEEIKSETTQIIRLIVKNQEDFEKIKEIIKNEYKAFGLDKISIDKKKSFMMKNDEAYVLVNLKNYDLTIETYNTYKADIITTNEDLFVLK